MQLTIGNIWDYADRWIVIPTNIGWCANGANPMGVGLAKEAALRFPDLPQWYGCQCKIHGATTGVCQYAVGRLILFPTKPLDESAPALSWRSHASMSLIERSIAELVELADKQGLEVAMPLVGCGAGKLDPTYIRSLLTQRLDDRFLLVQSPTA